MSVALIVGLAVALASVGPPLQLERQDRQDTIYVLRGEKAALEMFRREVGDGWTGGTLIDDQSAQGRLTYWAYSDRTAAESRALMMPAIFAGLDLGIEAYDQFQRFPVERGKLDQIAIQCGAKSDPFFVTPKRSVELSSVNGREPKLSACLSEGVRRLDARLVISNPRDAEEDD